MRNVKLITLLFLSTSFRLFAQADVSEIRSLRATVEAERQRIVELQLELERHNAVLIEITKSLDAITNTQSPSPNPASIENTPEAAAARPTVPESAPPRFDFYGESVMRLDNLRQGYVDCLSCPMRTRGRFRVRLGTEGRLAPGLRAVVGFSVGELNDANSTYQTLGGNFSRKPASWERAYI